MADRGRITIGMIEKFMKLKFVIFIIILRIDFMNAQIVQNSQADLNFSKLCGTWIWVKSSGICSFKSKDEEILGFSYSIEISKDSTFRSFKNNIKINEGKLKINYPVFLIQTQYENRLISIINQDTLYLGDGNCKKSIYARKKD